MSQEILTLYSKCDGLPLSAAIFRPETETKGVAQNPAGNTGGCAVCGYRRSDESYFQYAGREHSRHCASSASVLQPPAQGGGIMELLITLGKAFLVGGLFCAVGQVLIDKTKLTPARILVGYVVAGVLLSALGLYQPLVEFAGAGATVPLTGFGHLLATGVQKAVAEKGILGALTGGLTASAAGITAAMIFGLLVALIFNPGDKS